MNAIDDAVDSFSWIGPDDYGVVERLENEAIATCFYDAVIPVWPKYSVYVTHTPDGEERRIKIPLQARSVVLGYLRTPLWLASLIITLPGLVVPWRWGALIIPGLVLALVACVLTFFVGKLTDQERDRRSLLRRVVGFGAPPELLTESLRVEVTSNLELMWKTKSPHIDWIDAIEHGEASEILVALAEYHQEPELIEQAHANFANKLWN